MKKILIEWWGTGAGVFVEKGCPMKSLKVAGKVVVTVSVVDGQLHCDWDVEWKGWEDFHKSEDITGLFEKVKNLFSGEEWKWKRKKRKR